MMSVGRAFSSHFSDGLADKEYVAIGWQLVTIGLCCCSAGKVLKDGFCHTYMSHFNLCFDDQPERAPFDSVPR